MPNWNDGDILEVAKTMWMQGASGQYIADALTEKTGANVTKNAVIGKLNRLGMGEKRRNALGSVFYPTKTSHTPRMKRTQQAQRAEDAYREQAETKILAEQTKKRAREADIQLKTEIIVPPEERRNVLTRTAKQCHWPYDHPQSPDFHYCHHDHVPNLPYCDVHIHHAYVRLPKK
jgi:GcrA cell cycle regulator